MLTRAIAKAGERRTIEAIYDELLATGTVEANLPGDDRLVRDLHAEEVLGRRAPQPQASKVFPFKPRERVVTRIDQIRSARRQSMAPASARVIPLRPQPMPEPELAPLVATAAGALADDRRLTRAPMLYVVPGSPERPSLRARAGLTERLDRVLVESPPGPETEQEHEAPAPDREVAAAGGGRHFYLTLDQDVVDGPSIGAKTAERLNPHGIKTVRDLLKADPAALAVLVNARHITAEAISGWQDQARLVCSVPGLRGTHAQLLVGSGYRSGDAIATADPEKLCADVLAFAASTAGQRLLRNGDPPDIEKIKGWLEAARSMRAA